jgi:hypothetical protein
MVLWCSLSRAGIASVVPSGCSKRHGIIERVVQQRGLWRAGRENSGMDKDVWLRRIAVVLRIGMSKIENKSSKADYPTLPDVGTVFDV